jgi:hypothetical protein
MRAKLAIEREHKKPERPFLAYLARAYSGARASNYGKSNNLTIIFKIRERSGVLFFAFDCHNYFS